MIPSLALQESLTRITQRVLATHEVYGKPTALAKTASRLQTLVHAGGPQENTLLAIVQQYAADPHRAFTKRELRNLCSALYVKPDESSPELINQPDLFATLLQKWQDGFESGTLGQFGWLALLVCYMQRDRHAEACQDLRGLLEKTFPLISKNVPPHNRWIPLLQKHKCLLTNKPFASVFACAEKNRQPLIEQLRRELAIPPDSWFLQELVLEKAREVCGKPAPEFVQALEVLIRDVQESLPDKQAMSIKDEILKLLLTTYHASGFSEAHDQLREYTLALWASPSLLRNQKYQLVSREVRGMVQEWVARQDLKDFFTLLSSDRAADIRRLHFWSRYIKQIEHHRIFLGKAMARSTDKDVRELAKRPSVGTVDDADAEISAFVMRIKNWTIVEFSKTGNAAYFYKNDQIPFKMDDARVPLQRHPQALKNKEFAKTTKHHGGDWEASFGAMLAQVGIHPDTEQTKSSHVISQNSSFAITEFKKFVAEHKLIVRDNTSKGGTITVNAAGLSAAVSTQLKQWGFRLKNDKTVYWK